MSRKRIQQSIACQLALSATAFNQTSITGFFASESLHSFPVLQAFSSRSIPRRYQTLSSSVAAAPIRFPPPVRRIPPRHRPLSRSDAAIPIGVASTPSLSDCLFLFAARSRSDFESYPFLSLHAQPVFPFQTPSETVIRELNHPPFNTCCLTPLMVKLCPYTSSFFPSKSILLVSPLCNSWLSHPIQTSFQSLGHTVLGESPQSHLISHTFPNSVFLSFTSSHKKIKNLGASSSSVALKRKLSELTEKAELQISQTCQTLLLRPWPFHLFWLEHGPARFIPYHPASAPRTTPKGISIRVKGVGWE